MPEYEKSYLLRGYPRVERSAFKVLQDYFDRNTALEIIQTASTEYKEIMNKIPYIGGSKNPLTSNLIFSAQVLPLIILLKYRDVEADTIGKIIYEIGEGCVQSFNPILIKLARALFFSSFRMNGLSKRAEESKKRRYKGDWVFSFRKESKVEYRVDYDECGIQKLYTMHGYEEFVKYLCKLDFIICDKIGVKLERSKTIGNGDEVCDFRYFRTN